MSVQTPMSPALHHTSVAGTSHIKQPLYAFGQSAPNFTYIVLEILLKTSTGVMMRKQNFEILMLMPTGIVVLQKTIRRTEHTAHGNHTDI